jgi:hypothetical protein
MTIVINLRVKATNRMLELMNRIDTIVSNFPCWIEDSTRVRRLGLV